MKVKANHFDKKTFEELFDNIKHVDFSLFVDAIPETQEELSAINILVLQEPNEYFRLHDWAIENKHLFSFILTWDDKVINNCENAILLPFGHTWFKPDQYENDKEKIFELAHLRGNLLKTYGHSLRHELLDRQNEINIPKKWFHVLEDFDTTNNVRPGYGDYSKDLSHLPEYLKHAPQVYGKRICYEEPMFHVCVENVKSKNWYTEKIGEAFCTKTLPIYWGCPNIGEYYDIRGIITFETEDELLDILNNLTPEEYYKRKPYIDYNYQVALLDSFENKLDSLFKDIIDLNNL